MAYEKKIKGVDTPVGTMRLAGRDQQDINVATAAPSATGGAPKTISPTDQLMREVGATKMPPPPTVDPGVPFTLGPDPGYDPNYLNPQDRVNFQRSAELQPILPNLIRGAMHTEEGYATANPELIAITEDYVRGLLDKGYSVEGLEDIREPSQLARAIFAKINTIYEPHFEQPMPLAHLLHQTEPGRKLLDLVRQGREMSSRTGGRAI